MKFTEGNKLGLDSRFTSERQPDNAGRPLGVKNRSTIARKILEMSAILPENVFEKLKTLFPNIEKSMTCEEVASIVMIGNAIAKGDVNAYKAVMDSAYGAPKQEVEQSGNINFNIENVKVVFK